MEQEEKRRWNFTKEHYRELAKWMEKMALILFGAIVVQNFVGGIRLHPIYIIIGIIWTVATYYFALLLLNKS